jgi:hypothetical protein
MYIIHILICQGYFKVGYKKQGIPKIMLDKLWEGGHEGYRKNQREENRNI